MEFIAKLFVLLTIYPLIDSQERRIRCYDELDRAQRCMPSFENAAYGIQVDATNSCGVLKVTEYCLQTGVTGVTKSCQYCDARVPQLAHPPSHMTDEDAINKANWTWWQSETMMEEIQYPNTVNVTLNLRKAFDITYVRIRFHSSRPESFAIYKRTEVDGDWIPFQYYSNTCEDTYNLRTNAPIRRGNEAQAMCTDDYSDISPLTGGQVAFSTLVGRPSAYNFDNSEALQKWVTAREIKIVLTRVNTFGDEVFADPQVLKSYFYAISDLAVGATCKCNGHASECMYKTGQDLHDKLVCKCEHNTQGADCNECKAFFNDRPWARAKATDAHECQPCDCNGLAHECYFDEDLYRRTGHGGHCKDCRHNAAGAHCEICMLNHYRQPIDNRCIDCLCSEVGSLNMQCDGYGMCRCKPGITGDKCDRCQENFYDFSAYGCRACACLEAGSHDNTPQCTADEGVCSCKQNVEGQNCDDCKPGFFGLRLVDPFGCLACFCYGHSSECHPAAGYYIHSITTDFESGKQNWEAVDRSNHKIATQYNSIIKNLGVSAVNSGTLSFIAPDYYLGDQRGSYDQFLSFTLRIGQEGAQASIEDVVLEGNGQRISTAIFGQGNPLPRAKDQQYKFRLHEHQNYQWTPRLKANDFVALLSNLTAIKIRGTYLDEGVGFIDNIMLETARHGFNGREEAMWVEQCSCPEGYVGQYCESCSFGYRRDPPNGGPFAKCIPCNCYGHSDSCDVNTGRCICQHNTIGDNCERCVEGYYGNAREGNANDCSPCPCPNDGPCVELQNSAVICTQCHEGYVGNRCDYCADGYFGDPTGRYGNPQACQKCRCNDNIDSNAIFNCNMTSGECLKCVYNTAGFYCENCFPGFYGDALVLPKGQCQPCNCYRQGSLGGENGGILNCDSSSGQCACLSFVTGKHCDACEEGFWNLDRGQGCERCYCDPLGSLNMTCHPLSGQCHCREGITGLKCDTCVPYHYGFSIAGCQRCRCDPQGSVDMQCDDYGNCPCRDSVEGPQCNRCILNKYNITAGCIDCPPCYSLIEQRVHFHRESLLKLNNTLGLLATDPSKFDNTQFTERLLEVNRTIIQLLSDAKAFGGVTGSQEQIDRLRSGIADLRSASRDISDTLQQASSVSKSSISDIDETEVAIQRAEDILREAERYLLEEGNEALKRAQDAVNAVDLRSEEMERLAKRARSESNRQLEEAKHIEEVANMALNTSREALRIAQETITKPDDIAFEIQKIRQEFGDAERLYKQTRLLAENALELADKAYQQALDLYREASSITLPPVELAELKEKAQAIKDAAGLIKVRAEKLIEENAELMAEVAEQKERANELLGEGQKQQQHTDEFLADVDGARERASLAVEESENILEDARKTLEILNDFDKRVSESKKEAEKAKKFVKVIKEFIDQANDKTHKAKLALSGAESDAKMAYDTALEAQHTANNASEEASRIRTEAHDLKERARDLGDEVVGLAEETENVNSQVADVEAQAIADRALSETALKKAIEASKTADSISQEVNGALQTLEDILRILDGPMVNTSRLDALEQEIEAVEREIKAANLDEQYQLLLISREEQSKIIKGVQVDLEGVRKEVDNIEEIRNKLPDGCYKRLVLERGV